MMDILERLRRCKRIFDNLSSFRKVFLLLIFLFAILVYFGPWALGWWSSHKGAPRDPLQQCRSSHIDLALKDINNFDAHIKSSVHGDVGYVPYVGNGKIGLTIDPDSPLYLKTHRVLSLSVPFYPVISVNTDGYESSSATITSYRTGIVQRFECIKMKGHAIDVTYQYYAHRILPSLLVQDIKVVNPINEDIVLDFVYQGVSGWKEVNRHEMRLNSNGASVEIEVITGDVHSYREGQHFEVAILQTKFPRSFQVKRQSSYFIHVVTAVNYAHMEGNYLNIYDDLVAGAKKELERSFTVNYRKLREDHSRIWKQLWSTGFSISLSKAADALNGNKINATMYYVASHTRSPLYEVDTTEQQQVELLKELNNPDHCYSALHTLEAAKLWSDLRTETEMLKVVSLWKMTLEKNGCHGLLKAGADGVIQAMVLSFGAFKFSNHHIEFGMQPKYLHRDCLFRRISYGNGTHLNVSVVVGENNKAVLYVVLDRSDKNYYACDGGCLDAPVQLSQENQMFPVKLTDPPTAILYITSNKQHMEELKDTIHVREIVEAPAHEHHVIALHRHGHHFGGLPTMFWVSITFLVAVFHLFLFKLIYNEYCASQEKFRTRHSL